MEIIVKHQNVLVEEDINLKNIYRQNIIENCIDLADVKPRKIFEVDVNKFSKLCGIDYKYINPCCKYIITTNENNGIVCISICSNNYVGNSKCLTKLNTNCSLPHYISAPREYSNKNVMYTIYDVIFHHDVLDFIFRNLNVCDFAVNVTCEILLLKRNSKVCTTTDLFRINNGIFNEFIIRKDECTKSFEIIVDHKVNGTKHPSKKSIKKNLKKSHPHKIVIYDIFNHITNNIASNISKLIDINLSETVIVSAINNLCEKSKNSLELWSSEENTEILLYTQNFNKTLLNKTILDNLIKSDSENEIDYTENTDSITDLNDNTQNYFLDPNNKYQLPEYSCHLFNDIIIFTLHIKNVKYETLDKIYCKNDSAIYIKFSSTSNSSIENHYAFYLYLPLYQIDTSNVNIEVWDNNVVAQISYVQSNEGISSYMVGLSAKNLEEKIIEEPSVIFNKQINNKINNNDISPNIHAEIHSDEDSSVVHLVKNDSNEDISSSQNSNFTEDISSSQNSNFCSEFSSKTILLNNKNRLASESSGDELSLSPTKGILKMRRPRVGMSRSVSESSVDECIWSSFEYYNSLSDCIIHEEHSSMKKTVRFNDVVSKQLFRSNSSILGQKKKNQRKSRNKKRAQERRLSESENSEGEDKKEKYLKKSVKNALKDNADKKTEEEEEEDDEDDDDDEKLKSESRSELIFELDM